jgi:hypothetical protein
MSNSLINLSFIILTEGQKDFFWKMGNKDLKLALFSFSWESLRIHPPCLPFWVSNHGLCNTFAFKNGQGIMKELIGGLIWFWDFPPLPLLLELMDNSQGNSKQQHWKLILGLTISPYHPQTFSLKASRPFLPEPSNRLFHSLQSILNTPRSIF